MADLHVMNVEYSYTIANKIINYFLKNDTNTEYTRVISTEHCEKNYHGLHGGYNRKKVIIDMIISVVRHTYPFSSYKINNTVNYDYNVTFYKNVIDYETDCFND